MHGKTKPDHITKSLIAISTYHRSRCEKYKKVVATILKADNFEEITGQDCSE